jgi:hypothetical protein
MANVLFAVRTLGDLVGRFYSSSEADLSFDEKVHVCEQLGFVLDEGIVFQVAGSLRDNALLGREPNFTTSGTDRAFWIC